MQQVQEEKTVSQGINFGLPSNPLFMTNNSNGNSVNSNFGLINMEYPSSNSGQGNNNSNGSNGNSNSNGNNISGFNSSNIAGGSHAHTIKAAMGFHDQRNRNGSLGKSPKST